MRTAAVVEASGADGKSEVNITPPGTLAAGSGNLISGKYDSDGSGDLDATAFTVGLQHINAQISNLFIL